MLEFDTPSILLANAKSYFVSLVDQTGPSEAEHLRSLAKQAETGIKSREIFKPNADTDETIENNERDPLLV